MKIDLNKQERQVVLMAIVMAAMGITLMLANPKSTMGNLGIGFGVGAVTTVFSLRPKLKELKKDVTAVSPVIGVILMVAITVVLAAIVFVLVTQLSQQQALPTPQLSIQKDAEGNFTIIQAQPSNLEWSDFTAEPCTIVPTGTVDAGDKLEDCGGELLLIYRPTNAVIFKT